MNVITAEINSYKQVVGNAIFEIGRRLKHVKENDLAHGEFIPWLKKVGIEHTTAKWMMLHNKKLFLYKKTAIIWRFLCLFQVYAQ
ncbi:DUF3102 domain-containing protein [Aneurinibacillus migulanus]|uniref:DUF3102 domain-containing protein n=1 Tax=Aneurinibacillus migulanus TaxID=47500 RepID=UPI0009BA352B|nr:DUF3102 domain-containing protein [Aneurinibacillus migulanus]